MKIKMKLYTELRKHMKNQKQFKKQPNDLNKLENNKKNKTKTKTKTNKK